MSRLDASRLDVYHSRGRHSTVSFPDPRACLPMSESSPVSGHLPLTHSVFHILVSLADGPRHGYGVIVDVRERTGGRTRLGTGTLYTAIQRLLEQGLVTEQDSAGTEEDERRTATYAITDLGRDVLAAEAARLRELIGLADDVLATEARDTGR